MARESLLTGLAAIVIGCQTQGLDSGQNNDTSVSDDTSYVDTGFVDTGGYVPDTQDSGEDVQYAPEFSDKTLSSATVNSEYRFTVPVEDPDGDYVKCNISDNPEWLNIGLSNCELYGTPDESGTVDFTITATDSDDLSTSEVFELIVNSLATVDLYVYDAGGETDNDPIDTSCGIEATLIHAGTGYSETVSVNSDSIARFSLDQKGVYNVEVKPTNTGSNCYSGVSHTDWVDIDEGQNTSWLYLIPETLQDEVATTVENALDFAQKGYTSGAVDSVTKLFQYLAKPTETGFVVSSYYYSWDADIVDSTRPLYIEDLSGSISNDVDYEICLLEGLTLWGYDSATGNGGAIAPTIDVVPGAPGLDVYFNNSDWNDPDVTTTDVDGIKTIELVQIPYGEVSSEQECRTNMAWALGSINLGVAYGVDDFIMNYSPFDQTSV
ncbi:hypothetical protein COV16_01565, partial [Candidatus Woesearchaeota archaeon CG10_big_fil_rev_8_21_14_0_10_34_8]